jgi:hypothetical protein
MDIEDAVGKRGFDSLHPLLLRFEALTAKKRPIQ